MTNIKLLTAVGLLAAAIWYIPHHLQDTLSGTKPTQSFNEYNRDNTRESFFSSDLKELYAKSQSDPKDIKALRALASGISNKLNETESPPQALVFELIDVLQKILAIDPKDREALLTMGNLSYNFQIFDKAVQYFASYLELEKMDLNTRATYASALSFTGKFDEAEKELIYVISKDPKNFLARANLAINYTIAGDKDGATKAAAEAMPYAPSPEAKAKFNEFLTKLTTEPNEGDTQEVNSTGNVPDNIPQSASPKGPEEASVEAFIRSNPIAGPKFIRSKTVENKLELHFMNFPMKSMPPFAKEKFFTGIKEALTSGSKNVRGNTNDKVTEIVFLDHATGEVMETLDVAK